MESYFRVIDCPISQHIYLNPLQNLSTSGYVSIKEFTFIVVTQTNIPLGSIGLNPIYRKNLKVAIGDRVTVHEADPANIYPCHAMMFTVIRYMDPTINYDTIHLDTLVQGIQTIYHNQVFRSGQLVSIVYNTSLITCRVSGPGDIGEMLTTDTRVQAVIETYRTWTDEQLTLMKAFCKATGSVVLHMIIGYMLFLWQYNSFIICIALGGIWYTFITSNPKGGILHFCWCVVEMYVSLYNPPVIFPILIVVSVLYAIVIDQF
jgi:hypothetical protein